MLAESSIIYANHNNELGVGTYSDHETRLKKCHVITKIADHVVAFQIRKQEHETQPLSAQSRFG